MQRLGVFSRQHLLSSDKGIARRTAANLYSLLLLTKPYMYTTDAIITFEADGVYGTTDNPVTLPLSIINK